MSEQPKTVYVIDDQTRSLEHVQEELQDASWKVVTFATVDAAMAHMGLDNVGTEPHHLPHAIVTDYDTQSTYNALDLLRALKNSGVGLVLHTGDGNINADNAVEAAPEASFISKGDAANTDYANVVKLATEKAVMAKQGLTSKSDGIPR
jgi:DNA-binding NtrC family response regulator